MKYIANPVRVSAARILEVTDVTDCGVGGQSNPDLMLRLEDGRSFQADSGMTARYIPVEGDYVVTQEDGYTYINPRDVFERKYHPEHSRVSFAADREIDAFLRGVGDKIVARGEKVESAVVIYGSYGGKFYVESVESAVEAVGVMEIGKAVMLSAVIKDTFIPEVV